LLNAWLYLGDRVGSISRLIKGEGTRDSRPNVFEISEELFKHIKKQKITFRAAISVRQGSNNPKQTKAQKR
jgi:hypothetical protein